MNMAEHMRQVEDIGSEEVRNLRRALESRPTIEQAKGILMGRFHIDAVKAMGLLTKWSMDSNIKLRDIADALVDLHVSAPADADSAGCDYLRTQLSLPAPLCGVQATPGHR